MVTRSLAVLTVASLLGGCEVYVGHPYHHPDTVVYGTAGVAPAPVAPPPPAAPGPVVAEAAPPYVEEGTVVNGVVVAEPPGPLDYVEINGGWFYWHPGLHTWVHARRPAGWHPMAGAHIYHRWGEHPMYRR